MQEEPQPDKSQSLNTALYTKEEPDTICGFIMDYDLMADQNIKAGTVKVWNTEKYIYVKYLPGEGWFLTETHLYVGLLENIPRKNNGNPNPYQFPYSKSHGIIGYPDYVEYVVSIENLGELGEECPIVAAFAAMRNCSNPAISYLVSNNQGSTIVTERRSGDQPNFIKILQDAVLAWVHGGWNPSLTPASSKSVLLDNDAQWIWESYEVLDPVVGTVLKMETAFEMENVLSGNLYIACDNGFEAYLNDNFLGSANVYDYGGNDWMYSDLTENYVSSSGWWNIQLYDLTPFLNEGDNILLIHAANEQGNSGTVSSNPGAVIFALELAEYESEFAWGWDGNKLHNYKVAFGAKRWGYYIEYCIQECCTPDLTIENYDFETPYSGTGWYLYPMGFPGVEWAVVWYPDPEFFTPAYLEFYSSGSLSGVKSYSGHYFVELDTDINGPGGTPSYTGPETCNVRIYQRVTTCPSEMYKLTFYWMHRPGEEESCRMKVFYGGIEVFDSEGGIRGFNVITTPMNGGWNETVVNDLPGADGPVTIEFREIGPSDTYGTFLDRVSIDPMIP